MDRKEDKKRPPVTPTVSRIEVTHQRIRSDLEVLEKSDDLGQIRAVVDDLPDLLKEHFRDEEMPGGLYDELGSLCPALSPQLEILRQEHGQILQALEGLQRQLHELDKMTEVDDLEERLGQVRVRASVFLQLIHLHERIESGMVADTYYAEDGGSG